MSKYSKMIAGVVSTLVGVLVGLQVIDAEVAKVLTDNIEAVITFAVAIATATGIGVFAAPKNAE